MVHNLNMYPLSHCGWKEKTEIVRNEKDVNGKWMVRNNFYDGNVMDIWCLVAQIFSVKMESRPGIKNKWILELKYVQLPRDKDSLLPFFEQK